MATAAETALSFTVPATKAGLFSALGATASYLDGLGLSPRLCNRAAVLLEEALMNVVMHSRVAEPVAELPPVEVHVQVQLTAVALLLRVQDNGRPFDPLQVQLPPQDTLRDEARQGGFGVNLMRKMASAMHYEKQDGENVLTLTLAR